MAKVIDNILTKGLSGTIGKMLVFKQVNGETVVSKRIEKRTSTSAKQQEGQDRFKMAAYFAKAAAADTDLREVYATGICSRSTSVYSVALKDYLNAPVVEAVEVFKEQSKVRLKVLATDDFKVKQVSVTVVTTDGEEAELGDALPVEGTDYWMFDFTPREGDSGLKAEVKVCDYAGNCTIKIVNV